MSTFQSPVVPAGIAHKTDSVIGLFESQVNLSQTAEALRFGNVSLSYKELNQKAEVLANLLIEKGAEAQSLIGLSVERSHFVIIGLLAILKLEATYIPLDPIYPKDWIASIVNDSDMDFMLSLKEDAVNGIAITKVGSKKQQDATLNLDGDSRRRTYVMYTSGSTGKPKGVEMGSESLYNLICWQMEACLPKKKGKTLQFASVNFDVSFSEIFSTLCSGGCLVIASEQARRDPFELACLIQEEEVERIYLPSVMLKALIDFCLDSKNRLRSLKHIYTAGEQLRITENFKLFFEQNADCRLHNRYGPTETHCATAITLGENPFEWPALPPIGKAITNAFVHVLDEERQPVGVGIQGEIYIGGAGVAHGYFKNSSLTEEKFVTCASGVGLEQRMFRTGDRGWIDEQKNLHFAGRIDDQVKIRGSRVEPAEIEAVLMKVEGIRNAVVLAQTNAQDVTELVAFVIMHSETVLTENQIRRQIEKFLPNFMVPRHICEIERFPLTPNGKIDKRALLKERKTNDYAVTEISKLTEVEAKVFEAWQVVLGVTNIDRDEEFVSSGGYSLKAAELAIQLRKKFGIDISATEILDQTTPVVLVEMVETRLRKKKKNFFPEGRKIAGATPTQERIFAIQSASVFSTAYNLPFIFSIEGALDVKKLQKVAEQLIKVHPELNSCFLFQGARLTQVLRDDIVPLVHFRKVCEISEDLISELVTPFNLEEDLLFRLTLIEHGERCYSLFFDIHHIICDRASLQLLLRSISDLFDGKPAEKSTRNTICDYNEWFCKERLHEISEESGSFWAGTLPKLIAESPFKAQPTRPSARLKTLQRTLGAAFEQNLADAGKRFRCTPFVILLALLQIGLRKVFGRNIPLGIPVDCRDVVEADGLVGMFVNTLVVPSEVTESSTLKSYICSLKETLRSLYEHKNFPYNQLIDMALENLRHQGPLFDVMFEMQDVRFNNVSLGNARIVRHHFVPRVPMFGLLVTGILQENEVSLRIAYDEEKVESCLVDQLMHFLVTASNELEEKSDQKLGRLGEWSQKSQLEIIAKSTGKSPVLSWSEGSGIWDLWQKQVFQHGESLALVHKDKRLTYAQLHELCLKKISILASGGVSSGTRVVLCMDRSPDLIASILACVRLGATYVPIDPQYPQIRIEKMLDTLVDSAVFVEKQGNFKGRIILNSDNIAYSPCDLPGQKNDLDRTLYIIFTSGSTGTPKAAGVRERSALNLYNWQCEKLMLGEGSKVFLATAPSFDLTQKNIFATLISGGCLHLPNSFYFDPREMIDQIKAENISVLNCTPSIFRMLLKEDQSSGYSSLKSLRYLQLGGEILHIENFADWLQSPNCSARVFNTYGPTECSDVTSSYEISKKDIKRGGVVPVGFPLPGTKTLVLDGFQNVQPAGIEGEIYIGGVCLGTGYLNQPAMTEERFVRISAGALKGERLYRTGDVGFMNEQGAIVFVKRLDGQVKIRGYRVELGDIQSVILESDEVSEAEVVECKEGDGEHLKVFVTGQYPVDLERLRRFAAERLPSYMVPTYFCQLDYFPLNTNGKVDRNALSLYEVSDEKKLNSDDVPAMDEVENSLRKLWRRVLNLNSDIGNPDLDFFALGGHSLRAVKLAAEISDHFGMRFSAGKVFEISTLGRQAEHIRNNRGDSSLPEAEDFYSIV